MTEGLTKSLELLADEPPISFFSIFNVLFRSGQRIREGLRGLDVSTRSGLPTVEKVLQSRNTKSRNARGEEPVGSREARRSREDAWKPAALVETLYSSTLSAEQVT
jgi:hypothetical protein